MDRGEPAGVCNFSHPHSLPSHASLPPDGSRSTNPASRLDPLRHWSYGLPAEAHDSRGTGTRIRLDLPAAFLARFDLAPSARTVASCAAVSCDVISL